MKIASHPPSLPRPSYHEAARHINEEARLVLASLRCGPPHVARGELALGLRELRTLVRGQALDAAGTNGGAGGNGNHAGSDAGGGAGAGGGGESYPNSPRSPPRAAFAMTASTSMASTTTVPPPPLTLPTDEVDSQINNIQEGTNDNAADIDDDEATKEKSAIVEEEPTRAVMTPPSSPVHLSPPTPHSVPPSSPAAAAAAAAAAGGDTSTGATDMEQSTHQHLQPHQKNLQQAPNQMAHPGPYAYPFLAVIIDPRAAGPHTLVALRALHRLLERGSIVQLTRCTTVTTTSDTAATTTANNNDDIDGSGCSGENMVRQNVVGSRNQESATTNNAATATTTTTAATTTTMAQQNIMVHETKLEPIARGVLACRFEQTDAGADEAVEMAIADLLRLLLELDAAGARAVEAMLVKQVYWSRREKDRQSRMIQQQQQDDTKLSTNEALRIVDKQPQQNKSLAGGTTIQIQRLPSSVIMDAFHAVFVTRHTFVHDSGGHHSPALSFHFEQVLMRMIHVIFGGEDDQSALKNGTMMSSRHAGGDRRVLEFLIDSVSLHKKSSGGGDMKWTNNNTVLNESTSDDRRTLCLRLIQCCLRIGWGGGGVGVPRNNSTANEVKVPTMRRSSSVAFDHDEIISRLIEDDLCLALLTAGQAIFPQPDVTTSTFRTVASPSSSGVDILGVGGGRSSTSLELLSEVCATLSLLWSLPKLRMRLHAQFESIFSGFYQRALSLLRRRPLPEDGLAYQANMIFDMEAEVILESLVDILCLSSSSGGYGGSASGNNALSTVEDLFCTYDCSLTESDVASGLLVELSRCCGGVVDEDGGTYLPSAAPSRAATTGALTPYSLDSESKTVSPILIARYRSVPDHLKELCSEALLGCVRLLFYGAETLSGDMLTTAVEMSSLSSFPLRAAKNKKRILRHAAKLFNEKPKNGLKYLAENGLLPNPPDPKSVASFLRNGLVVGLDKAVVGQYLGEVGKSAKDSDVTTDQDWFHKELLVAFCSSFDFERQTVLDGLRMFLSTFRLPGEAQMIDRILQAFSESVSHQCEESVQGSLKLFSPNEKRASDAAYLLSFSIIMLNTDLHNENIRANRKMKLVDFIRNNRNYGKDISDNDLPAEYLEEIFRNIKEEQIRTLGEGADGFMTVERWKDVMRSAAGFRMHNSTTSALDVKAIKELLLESSWQPILSAISGLWGMVPPEVCHADLSAVSDNDNILRVRLGIDLAYEMLSGSSKLCRPDIFQDLFTNICHMSGLLGEYNLPAEERADNFIKSFERQSAFTAAMNVAEENGDLLGIDGWKCVWAMVFELRDLQLLSGITHLMKESDPDLLSPEARTIFCRRMASRFNESDEVGGRPRRGVSLMSFVFGSSDSFDGGRNVPNNGGYIRSTHGKDDHLIWDDCASSDEEDEHSSDFVSFPSEFRRRFMSIGASFENQLVCENATDIDDFGTTVTGLERLDLSTANTNSLRARVRRRLSKLVDFQGLVAESRYLSEEGLSDELNSLVEIIRDSSKKASCTIVGENNGARGGMPISSASEAFAEILICEIALKNRDRFTLIWDAILRAHYNSRLTYKHNVESANTDDRHQPEIIKLTPGIEKCVTGILRLCVWTSNRNINPNEVLSMLKMLHPPCALIWSPLELNLDKHLAEGLWRIVTNVDGLSQINDEGWGGILGLAEWCAARGGLQSDSNTNGGGLDEDDPSLQAFRSLHLILHAVELKDALRVDQWPLVVKSVRCLVEAGERGHCPKLSIASLDLLQVINARLESVSGSDGESSQPLLKFWVLVLEAMSEPAEKSRNGSVRQQAISLLTDSLLDKNSNSIPVDGGLHEIMNSICIPLVEKRVTDLLRIPYDVQSDLEETLAELELCISLLFKPFLHHIKALVSVKQEFIGIWISMLGIVTLLLGESAQNKVESKAARDNVVTRAQLFNTTKELASEHLRNAVMVLAAMGVLIDDSNSHSDSQEISLVTWAAIGSIGYCKPFLNEWKKSACQL